MAAGPLPLGIAAFAAIKLTGYTLAGRTLNRANHVTRPRPLAFGAARTLLGIIAGVSYATILGRFGVHRSEVWYYVNLFPVRQLDKIYLARVARDNLTTASAEMLDTAAIPIERSAAAILLIGGDDDQLWDSGASVKRLETRLERARYPHPHQALRYPLAGHALLGTGWHPTTEDNADAIQNGGTAEADERAQADAWPRVIAFLQRVLRAR